MITKYASLESAEVLGIKGSEERVRTASLDKFADFNDYRTEDGYLYARIRAISSRVNKNHDGWPSVELAGSRDIFDQHTASEGGFTVEASKGAKYGFSTFLGKPVFVDHNNSNPDRARGVIVDAKLHVEDHKTASQLDPYYASAPDEHMPPTWVELLLEIDADKFPKLAKAIIDGSKDSKKGIDGFSMGCNVEKSVCSICKNAATSPDEYCNHVKLKGAHFDFIDAKTGHKTSKRSYEDCYGVQFFEISAVFDPADETALIREVRASVEKEGAGMRDIDPGYTNPEDYNGQSLTPGIKRYMGFPEIPCPTCKGNSHDCPQCHGEGLVPVATDGGFQLGGIEEDSNNMDPRMWGMDQQPWGDKYPIRQGATKTAENPLPQSDMVTAPEKVDTLREEQVCPVCGSTMDEGHQCDVCGYVTPPDGLDNPDLSAAQDFDQEQDVDQAAAANPQDPVQLDNPALQPNPPAPNNMQPAASVSNEMAWQISHPKVAGRINPTEKPIKPGNPTASNEPQETILSDQERPVTSRTAASMIAAVQQGDNMSEKTADAAAGAPEAATPDKRVDVEGVGGVMDASNESASKADAQVDVEGRGGTGVEDVEADEHQSVEETSDNAGFDKGKRTDDSGPTKTWGDGKGKFRQADPVGGKAFPTSAVYVASGEDPNNDAGGGSAKQGVEPIDPVGKADERVDVMQQVTVNNPQKGTDQWTGTDGNGVTKQQPAVTRDTMGYTSSLVEILKLADAEVDLGLIEKDEKYDRIAELEQEAPEVVQASLAYVAKIRTAGLRRSASTVEGGVGRVPSFGKAASIEEPKVESGADDQLFLR